MGADSIHEPRVGIARTRGYGVAMQRLLPLLGVLALACVCASATHAAPGGVPQLLFPVVGTVTYEDDFGDPRGALRHQGNDLLGDKRAPVVAVEEGTVKYWTTSSSAGCMLYLYGASGTMYEYIHLNNDLTAKNDNKGKCVKGVAYAVADGTHVEAGQQIAYLGDSGDANGIHPHLHFEVHPKGKAAVDPFPFLKKASHLVTVAPPAGSSFTLKLSGTLVSSDGAVLTITVQTIASWPSHVKQTKVNRDLELTIADATLAPAAVPGTKLTVWTQPAPGTLEAITGAPGALTLDKLR
jgi:Peptidase family M23